MFSWLGVPLLENKQEARRLRAVQQGDHVRKPERILATLERIARRRHARAVMDASRAHVDDRRSVVERRARALGTSGDDAT